MATTVVKEKDAVMFRTKNGDCIGKIFHLQDHVAGVVQPTTLFMEATFELNNKK
jgi:hypothetical protein